MLWIEGLVFDTSTEPPLLGLVNGEVLMRQVDELVNVYEDARADLNRAARRLVALAQHRRGDHLLSAQALGTKARPIITPALLTAARATEALAQQLEGDDSLDQLGASLQARAARVLSHLAAQEEQWTCPPNTLPAITTQAEGRT
jgi:uncharacterized protein YuzB (UPF0349 family)